MSRDELVALQVVKLPATSGAAERISTSGIQQCPDHTFPCGLGRLRSVAAQAAVDVVFISQRRRHLSSDARCYRIGDANRFIVPRMRDDNRSLHFLLRDYLPECPIVVFTVKVPGEAVVGKSTLEQGHRIGAEFLIPGKRVHRRRENAATKAVATEMKPDVRTGFTYLLDERPNAVDPDIACARLHDVVSRVIQKMQQGALDSAQYVTERRSNTTHAYARRCTEGIEGRS